MNTFKIIIASLILLVSFQVSAQENATGNMNFALRLMDDNMTWGVFAVPGDAIMPSKRSSTGSGQVTIVAPVGFTYTGLENESGSWIENARVDAPMESPDFAYISFGFVVDEPRIKYVAGQETLLFTFIPEDANAEISLFDNENDPFAAPNTYGSNPGNDLGVIDFNRNGDMLVYNYGGNIEASGEVNKAVLASQKADIRTDSREETFKAVFASEKTIVPSN
ncbi:MAG: hypothetical protein IT258_13655 [Saprospiraceae bacterium]|nr:hypothetical protein [Saprospiraceae bacterium]